MRTSLRSVFCLAILAAGCGGISDPTRSGSASQTSAVSGSLKGADPNATDMRVAILWRTSQPNGGLAIGADAPIVNGQFSLNLAEPPAEYFFPMDEGSVSSVTNGSSGAPSTTPVESPPSPPLTTPLRPQGGVGGQIAPEMTAALGGFVVYRDANGNGALDLDGEYLASADTVIGGNNELLLIDLEGGGALDFEKLRDRSGVLPSAGMNLAWTEGRWLGLDLVELELNTKNARLPSDVCSGGVSDAPIAVSGDSSGGGTSGNDPDAPYVQTNSFDKPEDVICAPDGRSYRPKNPSSTCGPTEPPPPPRPSVCTSGVDFTDSSAPCAGVSSISLPPNTPAPEGWPCPVGGADAGPTTPPNPSVDDAGAGPG